MAKQRRSRSNGSRRARRLFKPFQHRAQVGSVPGKVEEHESSSPTVVNTIQFGPGFVNEWQGMDKEAVLALVPKPDVVTWIDISGFADAALIEAVGRHYEIHPLLMEDVVHTHQRPKVEVFDNSLAVILRMVSPSFPLMSEQVCFVLCGSTVLTFQEHHGGDSFEPVRKRIRQKLGTIRTAKADYTMYSLIDSVIDGFFPLLEDFGRTLEQIEDALEEAIDDTVQRRVHTIRTELSQLRKIAWGHREALQRLVAEGADHVDPSTLPFLRDCLDHTGQVLDVAETFRDVAADMRDLYFAQLSQRTNEVMKLLTIISTIFMPLSFIAGVYGMNFNADISPYNMPETQWRFGYPIILLVMAVTAFFMLGYFVRKGWLFRR